MLITDCRWACNRGEVSLCQDAVSDTFLKNLLKKKDQNFLCGAIFYTEKNGWVRFVVDNFQGGEIDCQYVVSRMS